MKHVLGYYALDDLRNAAERDSLFQKQLHRDLVGRVEPCRRRSAKSRRLAPDHVSRKPIRLQCLERERAGRDRIEAAHPLIGHAIGIGQRVQDRQLHRGESYLGEHRAVYELREPVND